MLRYLAVIMTTLSIVFGSMSVVQASEREDVIKTSDASPRLWEPCMPSDLVGI